MNLKALSLYLIFFSSISFSQQIGQWKNFTNMKNVRAVVPFENKLWAATGGGLFSYNLDDSSFISFTNTEGLSSQDLSAITVDNEGKIWIGSEEGFINVYNPSTDSFSKILDIASADQSLKSINDIKFIDSKIYISTDFGLSIIDPLTLNFAETILKFGDFISESKVYKINHGNSIYVGTENGISILKENFSNISAPESWETTDIGIEVFEILEYQNTLIASTTRGIFELGGGIWSNILFPNFEVIDMEIFGDLILCVLLEEIPLPENRVQRNYYFYEVTPTSQNLIYSTINDPLNGVYLDNNQVTHLLTSSNGILKFNNGENTIAPNGPGSNLFQSVAVDSDGNVWAGSGADQFGVGIFKYDGETWTTFNTENTQVLPSNAYHKAYTAQDNTLYFSNWGNGFAKYKDNSFEIFNTANTDLVGISNDPDFVVISAIENDSQNNIWMVNFLSANAKPLSVLTSDNQWFHYSFTSPSITSTEECQFLTVDRFDTKWFAVTKGTAGLYYYNENKTFDNTSDDSFGFLNESSGLESDNITALAIDQRGELWVGTSVGVSIIPNTSQPSAGIRFSIPLRGETITTLAVDPLNQKWVGTQNGVFIMSSDGGKVLEQYNSANSPLPTNEVKSITFDEKKGIAYLGTDFGLTSLTTSSIQPKEGFDELFVYPNPFIIEDNNQKEITIDGLIRDSEIKILSISGKLIKEFMSPGGRVAFWDGRDENGTLVPSGVYIIVAFDEEANNVAKSKIVVLRK